jgi:hypothetical protein
MFPLSLLIEHAYTNKENPCVIKYKSNQKTQQTFAHYVYRPNYRVGCHYNATTADETAMLDFLTERSLVAPLSVSLYNKTHAGDSIDID